MQVFDASSMIYAWDNYPVKQFPALWKWIAGQIEQKLLVMPRVAFEEVAGKTPDCRYMNEEAVENAENDSHSLQFPLQSNTNRL